MITQENGSEYAASLPLIQQAYERISHHIHFTPVSSGIGPPAFKYVSDPLHVIPLTRHQEQGCSSCWWGSLDELRLGRVERRTVLLYRS